MSIKAIPTKSVTKLKVCLAGPSPHLNEDELPLAELPLISMDCIARAYKPFAKKEHLLVYQNTDNCGFVAGVKALADKHDTEHLVPTTSITVKHGSYPGKVAPSQLTSEWYQVAMVLATRSLANQRYTRTAYELIASKCDLVSDRKQYWAAKNLWKSLARGTQVNVYVFDGSKEVNDYLRDDDGNPVAYNGKDNIPEATIWGRKPEYYNRLLVATVHRRV